MALYSESGMIDTFPENLFPIENYDDSDIDYQPLKTMQISLDTHYDSHLWDTTLVAYANAIVIDY